MTTAYALMFLIGFALLVLASIGGRAGMSARDRWAMWFRWGRQS